MTPSRPYRSTLRAEQASETRRRVLRAAREIFTAKGYAASTIKEVAETAGVSPQTVYAAFRSKAGLVRALVDYGNEEAGAAELAKGFAHAATPREFLAMSVHLVCVLHERIGDLIAMFLQAAAADPSLAPVVDAGRASHSGPQLGIAQRLAAAGVLHDDLDFDSAVHLLVVMTSPETIGHFVHERGLDYPEIESLVTRAVVRAICRDDRADEPWPT